MLSKGRPAVAAEAMREHIAVGLERTLEVLQPYFKMRERAGQTFFRSEKKRQLQGFVPRPDARLRSLEIRASSGEARRSAVGAKAAADVRYQSL